jgi:transposase
MDYMSRRIAVSEMAALGTSELGVPAAFNEPDRAALERLSRSRTLPARVVLRSQIVLMLLAGKPVNRVALALNVTPNTVRLWRSRFSTLGFPSLLHDASGRGRKPKIDVDIRATLRGDARSVRQIACALHVSASTVSRWRRR